MPRTAQNYNQICVSDTEKQVGIPVYVSTRTCLDIPVFLVKVKCVQSLLKEFCKCCGIIKHCCCLQPPLWTSQASSRYKSLTDFHIVDKTEALALGWLSRFRLYLLEEFGERKECSHNETCII